MKALVIGILSFLASHSLARASGIDFIVNESNPVTQLPRSQVSNFFLKKTRSWPNGGTVRFFDRADLSVERRTFLAQYLNKSARQLEQYWIGQKLYSGDSAPTQISSDSMMVKMVSRLEGSIGYVSKNAPLPDGVKRVTVTED